MMVMTMRVIWMVLVNINDQFTLVFSTVWTVCWLVTVQLKSFNRFSDFENG